MEGFQGKSITNYAVRLGGQARALKNILPVPKKIIYEVRFEVFQFE